MWVYRNQNQVFAIVRPARFPTGLSPWYQEYQHTQFTQHWDWIQGLTNARQEPSANWPSQQRLKKIICQDHYSKACWSVMLGLCRASGPWGGRKNQLPHGLPTHSQRKALKLVPRNHLRQRLAALWDFWNTETVHGPWGQGGNHSALDTSLKDQYSRVSGEAMGGLSQILVTRWKPALP